MILTDSEREIAKQIQAENGLSSLGNVFRYLLHGKKSTNNKIRFVQNKRKKITITISQESLEHVKEQIRQGNTTSLSRLIDILVLEHAKNTEIINEFRLAHEQAKRLKEAIENGI